MSVAGNVVKLEQIGYASLQDVAYDRILQALFRGTFRQGERLPTRTLAKALGISTTPVREALARLVAQNVLAVDSVNGRPYVPVLTRELLCEIYELRTVLEGLAAERAAENITREELAQLERLWAKLAVGSIDHEERQRIGEEFQFIVYRAARRPVLLDLIRSVWLRSSLVVHLLAKTPPKELRVECHREKLLAALNKGAAKHAGDMTRAAIDAARDMLLGVMDE